ncbi:SPT16-domain-containing protein, partial [Wolfiporia cocos MD-104 SS10]
LTSGVKSIKDTMFFLSQGANRNGQSLAPAKKVPATKLDRNASSAKNKTAGRKVFWNKTHSAAHEELIQSTAVKIAEHQSELHTRLQTDGLAKYSEGGGSMGRNEGKGWKRFQSYKGKAALPLEVEASALFVVSCDMKVQTIVLPIHGFAVPFHINTIKNVSKNDETEVTYLCVNFQTPGQLAGKKEDTVSTLALPISLP